MRDKKPIPYSPEIVEDILDLYAGGMTLSAICRLKHMPHKSTFRRWCDAHPDIMARMNALNPCFVDSLVDESLQIADSAIDAQRARNQISARQWLASRLNSGKYGDKVQVEVEHKLDLSKTLEMARARLQPNCNPVIDAQAQLIENKPAIALRAADNESVPSIFD